MWFHISKCFEKKEEAYDHSRIPMLPAEATSVRKRASVGNSFRYVTSALLKKLAALTSLVGYCGKQCLLPSGLVS